MSADIANSGSPCETPKDWERTDDIAAALATIGNALSGADCQNSLAGIFRGTPEALDRNANATEHLANEVAGLAFAIESGLSKVAEAIRLKS